MPEKLTFVRGQSRFKPSTGYMPQLSGANAGRRGFLVRVRVMFSTQVQGQLLRFGDISCLSSLWYEGTRFNVNFGDENYDEKCLSSTLFSVTMTRRDELKVDV